MGTYEFSTLIDGQTVGGTLEITGTPGAYSGWIRAEGVPPIPITSVTVQGQSMRIGAQLEGQGPVAIDLDFTGAEFTGSWSVGEAGGVVNGRKVS